MKPFEIGWIPDGWEKGEPLVVRKLKGPEVIATIAQMPKAYDENTKMVNSFMLTIPYAIENEAYAWLKWWEE